jgi:quinoprotein glucose dehydrogenase
MPFGAPATDRYGGDRPGDNLYSSSIVAADANAGKYLGHFQVVHHDIWDADLEAPPALFNIKRGANPRTQGLPAPPPRLDPVENDPWPKAL